MKKLLGLALTLALVIPSGPASAELFKNMKAMGGVDVQGTSARNIVDFQTRPKPTTGGAGAAATTGHDHIGTTATRVWAGLGWDLLDDVHAKVTLRKNDRSWGTVGGAATSQQAGGSQAWGIAGATGVEANTFLNEAYVKIDKMMGHLDTTWGRQFWGEPGDLIAFWGPKNVYGLFVTAIDALSASASNDWMNFQGIAGKIAGAGTAIGAVNGGDTDVQGIDIGWKMLPVKVNTFLWHRQIRNVGGLGVAPSNAAAGGINDNLYLYGARVRGEAMGGWFTATAALNSGSNRAAGTATGIPSPSANYIGKGILLDAGYRMDVADIGGFTPWFTWGWGSGRHNTASNHNENFTTIAPDFRPGVIYGRFPAALSPAATALGNTLAGVATAGASFDGAAGVATAGLTNRIIWGGGLKFNCARSQKMTVGASYWDFSYQRSTQAGANPPGAIGNRHIGSELDLQVDWAHSENVMLSGGWATFQPGGFIKETIRANTGGAGAGVSPATMLFADLSVKF